jgi:hypothetical protein
MRRRRRVKPRGPDVLVLYRAKLVTVEMKSISGRCSRAQREARLAILAAGDEWWKARSANAAILALTQSGVPVS